MTNTDRAIVLARLLRLHPSLRPGRDYYLAGSGDATRLVWVTRVVNSPTAEHVLAMDEADIPAIEIRISPSQLWAQFTASERSAFNAATLSDATLRDAWADMLQAESISLSSPRLAAVLDYCITLGILTQQRRNEILTV